LERGRAHALLVNPSSGHGRGRSALPRVEAAFEAHGLAFRTLLTRSMEHGVEAARLAVQAGEVPVVLGGDGLIGRIGGALAGTGSPLGLLPGGRGNDLCRVLGIPPDPVDAVSVIAAGAERSIDVGEVNGRRFLCIASLGLDSVVNGIANRARFLRGKLVYTYAALRALATWRTAHFSVTLDHGEAIAVDGYAVAVANGGVYGGGMRLAPDAKLDDGLLDVVITGEVGKLRFVLNLPKVFRGTHVDEPEIAVTRARTVRISADRPFEVYGDGEYLTDLPAEVRLLDRALRVLAPPAQPAS
jgi:YegS/Rv2252/BmrU family lipid kinase